MPKNKNHKKKFFFVKLLKKKKKIFSFESLAIQVEYIIDFFFKGDDLLYKSIIKTYIYIYI